MATLRWAAEKRRQNKDAYLGFFPTWTQLAAVMRLLLRRRGSKARLAEHSRVSPSRLSRYFLRVGARQPDGEFALRAWIWVLGIKGLNDSVHSLRALPAGPNWQHFDAGIRLLEKFVRQEQQLYVRTKSNAKNAI